MTFRCLKPGCPVDCGTCRRLACSDRMICRALFLTLVLVIVLSLAIGFIRLSEAAPSRSISESTPVARAELVQLVGDAADDARQGILSDPHGKSAIAA